MQSPLARLGSRPGQLSIINIANSGRQVLARRLRASNGQESQLHTFSDGEHNGLVRTEENHRQGRNRSHPEDTGVYSRCDPVHVRDVGHDRAGALVADLPGRGGEDVEGRARARHPHDELARRGAGGRRTDDGGSCRRGHERACVCREAQDRRAAHAAAYFHGVHISPPSCGRQYGALRPEMAMNSCGEVLAAGTVRRRGGQSPVNHGSRSVFHTWLTRESEIGTVIMNGLGAERSFGALLRAARLDAALTQQDLATRCGMSVRAISDLERNRTRRPYLRSVRLLAEALNVPRPLRDAMLAASRCGERDGHPADKAGCMAADQPAGHAGPGVPAVCRISSAGLWHEMRTQAELLATVAEQLVEAVAKTAALAEDLADLRVHASRTERDHRADPPAGN